jgi:peptidoglycan hydrolase-like protein with peptidoglycan-binding domain
VSASPQAPPEEAVRPAKTEGGRPPRRRRRVIVGLVVLVLAAGTLLVITRPFGGGGGEGNGIDNGSPTSLASVTRRSLASRINVNGTLGYAGSYDVANQATGTLSALPAVGDLIEQGDVLYRVDGSPVVLLEGSTPAYRVLVPGMAGPDVRQLNADLVDLGYATQAELDPTSDRFDWQTSRALRKLQADVGLEPTGIVPLGEAVFLPTGIRVTELSATLGTAAQAGTSILSGTSTARRVHIDLDAAQQSQVKEGDQATITMPDGQTTPGVVSKVGTVATTPSDASDSADSSPTIPVVVTPTHPAQTGELDQAPVLVSITTETVKNVLVVPVDALIALSGGGYAVEVDSGGSRHLVTVTLGMFDDAEGLVQVSGPGLRDGQRVVVPAS